MPRELKPFRQFITYQRYTRDLPKEVKESVQEQEFSLLLYTPYRIPYKVGRFVIIRRLQALLKAHIPKEWLVKPKENNKDKEIRKSKIKPSLAINEITPASERKEKYWHAVVRYRDRMYTVDQVHKTLIENTLLGAYNIRPRRRKLSPKIFGWLSVLERINSHIETVTQYQPLSLDDLEQ